MCLPGLHALAAGSIPDGDGAVVIPAGYGCAIRRNGDRGEALFLSFQDSDQLPRRWLPEANCLVLTCRDEQFAIRREGDGYDPGLVSAQMVQFLAGADLPNAE